MKPITIPIVVPSCLTPDSDLLAGISKRIERRNKASHLLGYLHTGRYDQQRDRDFVPLSSDMAERLYTPAAYKEIRNFLQRNLIIESDNDWRRTTEKKKGYCKGWRINDRFETDSVICQIRDKGLLKNLNKERSRIIRNYTDAIRQMECDLRQVGLPPGFDLNQLLGTLPEDITPHAKACLLSSITKINDSESDWNNTISQGRIGRRFHKINNASKDLRKWLTIAGDPTCEVDVSNCQPLLMAVILDDPKMIRSCSEGNFYEDLMEASPVSLTRDEMKEAALRDVIAKTPKGGIEYWHGKPADLAFQKAFPTAYLLNEEYRAKHGDLAMIHELQRLESEIIHADALPVIQKRGHRAVSIHDSFLTTKSSSESVGDALGSVFRSKTGESCKVTMSD